MEYTTLNERDKLALAQDTLRGLESDHYRLSLLAEQQEQYAERVAELEAEILNVREAITAQQVVVNTEPPPEEPPTE